MGKPLKKNVIQKKNVQRVFVSPGPSLGLVIFPPLSVRTASSHGSGLRLHVNYMDILTDHTDFPVIVSAIAF